MSANKRLSRIALKILAIAEKDTVMLFRFKYGVMLSYFTPIISILIPIFVFGKIFEFTSDFGPWTEENYIVFVFTGYCILLLRRMMETIPGKLREEKFWKTLPALIIAPFNRYYLLFGYFISEFIMFLIPFVIFLVILMVLFPISFVTLIFIFFTYLAIAIVFTGIGLVLGIFAISNENIWGFLKFAVGIIIWASCITYPFQLFPEFVQSFINLNPIYYIIDLIRLFWIENNIIITFSAHISHVFILLISSLIFPIFGVYIFNVIYKKLGISGY
jgi:ABC-type polysaccharide/polyol phosphate export permease